MRSPFDEPAVESSASPWLYYLIRGLPPLLFLALAIAGMIAVFLFFSPTEGNVEIVSAVRSGALTAPLFKVVPPRPVTQRIAQSPAPMRIGIISGHRGNDSGAVCEDGLTEAEVNFDIASQVVSSLRAQGIRTDLLEEFDERLTGYRGTALISIHADSCGDFNDQATGFKIAGSYQTPSDDLTICLETQYAAITGLPYHANTITLHMTDYHAFREVAPGTPASIIETGFMNLDRELLTENSDTAAGAIVAGIICYLGSERQ